MAWYHIDDPKPLEERLNSCYLEIDRYLDNPSRIVDNHKFGIHTYTIKTLEKGILIKVITRFQDDLLKVKEQLEEVGDKHFAELGSHKIEPADDTIHSLGVFILEF